jgi:hypothetical protein
MLTRRMFLSAAAAGAATLSNFARLPELDAAAGYDLVIAGGRVIDPSRKFDAVSNRVWRQDRPVRSTRAANWSCRASSTSTPTPAARRKTPACAWRTA